ncbi:hypothetical protein GGX14DRAFT_572132 [Mycena pura]|uniref:Uncharacterized protein n=1 Tax=Mycena pura TaxID=153505 RepID=A0AAD6V2E2_9AGAR|nr:hypothetical protein GGX14DRAFT_572132 [Mycena pura]
MPPRKKPGKPSDFQGQRVEFLLAFYPMYADASKRGKTRTIWKDFFVSYWSRFPWRLPLTQDPDPTDYALPPENEEEEAAKAKIMPELEGKIKSWLGRQGKVVGMKGNPWTEWLTRFRTPAGLPPKKLADYQFYMQHKDHKSKVAEAFKARCAGVPASEHLRLRGEVARELLAGEPQELREAMKAGADAEHAALMEKHARCA